MQADSQPVSAPAPVVKENDGDDDGFGDFGDLDGGDNNDDDGDDFDDFAAFESVPKS